MRVQVGKASRFFWSENNAICQACVVTDQGACKANYVVATKMHEVGLSSKQAAGGAGGGKVAAHAWFFADPVAI